VQPDEEDEDEEREMNVLVSSTVRSLGVFTIRRFSSSINTELYKACAALMAIAGELERDSFHLKQIKI
jgi:hypothetical protein